MEVVCPSCKFKGNIKDENIPDSGREVTCPHCKTKFFVRKKETEKPKSEMVGNVVSEPPRGSIRPNVSKIREESITKKPIFVCSSLLLTAVVFFVFGIIAGFALFSLNLEPNTEIARSDDVAVSPPKTTPSDTLDSDDVEDDPTEVPPSSKEEDVSLETLFSTEGKVEVYELIKNLLPLSEIQTEKFLEDNLYLEVYGTGTVKDVKEIDLFWEALLKNNSGENKYGVEITLDHPLRSVIMGVSMDDSDVMKINRGDKVKFSGELLSFTTFGHGTAIVLLYDGKVVKD